jgi:L-asparaginase
MPKAIMLFTYHSGTIVRNSELEEFLLTAKMYNIPVFLCGADTSEQDYASVNGLQELGVIVLPKASPIAMYVKLWMILSSGIRDINEIRDDMLVEIAGDIV